MKEPCPGKVFLGAILSGLTGMALATGAVTQDAPPQDASLVNIEEFPQHVVGDLGFGAFESPSDTRGEIRSKRSSTRVLPYAYLDYGRFFARVDTFGIKTFKMGYGYFELAGRITFDGFKTSNSALRGLTNRKNDIPLGIGTFQETPIGAFFLNAFYDVNQSHGTMLEGLYTAEVKAGSINFYPQIGAEYRNANFVNYYYGITPAESAANGHYKVYEGKGTINPMVALQVEIPLNKFWVVNLYGRYKWLGDGIKNSPIVVKKTSQNYFVSLAYRFQ
ncbi:MipA/OmpV family protein [Glaciimonas immobilis]|uniref:Outer membrane protein n=1 Tax=Glaciimonas immobilis TaxID=728004 RepID=A0A840S021_9BURK|nr:MipA/OmpV family protein [Glaciimonas immobilis]KAF3998327.1 MipA/OmpV family protein [Glaciimonas immobilis]MBB5201949.1 outer membrane protein [Glaciimonas immobilis]